MILVEVLIRRTETFSNANSNYGGANVTGSGNTPSGAVEDGQYNSMPMNVEFTIYNPSTNSSQGVYRYELDYISYHPYRIGNRGHLFHTSNWTGLSLFWASSDTFTSF